MADNALLASMLMQQKTRTDPNEAQAAFARKLMQFGSSTAPVQSPLEGLARALQAGLGGYFAGEARRSQEEDRQADIQGLAGMLGATTNEQRMEHAKKLRNPDLAAPLIGQILTASMERDNKNALATNAYTAAGGVVPGATPAPGPIGEAPPLPQGTPAPGGFANNLGNIRATNLPWDGKGPPQNGFETFNTPQAGANAMVQNLGAYVKQNPGITVAQAIAKWAPPNENDTNLYIRQVSEGTGINPGAPLAEVLQDPAMAAQMLDAMTRKEKGGLPQGVTADTFMNATTPGGNAQQPGQPLQINMTPGMPQGSADGRMPPAAPQVAQAPAAQPPQPPSIAPAAAELSRQAQAAFQAGDPSRAAALQQKAQEAQAAYAGDIDKERRALQTKEYSDAQTRAQPTRTEIEKLHTARTEAATIVSALEDFRREFENTGTWGSIKSVAGATTPVNTAYNTAALMAKGEQLFALGVLNGPDLEVIRRILPDPSTVRGAATSNQDMSAAVGKVVDLLQTRLAARETQLGLPVTDVRGAANNLRATQPGGPTQQPTNGPIAPGAIEEGYRFKGGNPADKSNWERVQ